MKLVIYFGNKPPMTVEGVERVALKNERDVFEVRPSGDSTLVRIETHDGGLACDLAVFPNGGNGVRLKGGLR